MKSNDDHDLRLPALFCFAAALVTLIVLVVL
jgi:hypothetical protein